MLKWIPVLWMIHLPALPLSFFKFICNSDQENRRKWQGRANTFVSRSRCCWPLQKPESFLFECDP